MTRSARHSSSLRAAFRASLRNGSGKSSLMDAHGPQWQRFRVMRETSAQRGCNFCRFLVYHRCLARSRSCLFKPCWNSSSLLKTMKVSASLEVRNVVLKVHAMSLNRWRLGFICNKVWNCKWHRKFIFCFERRSHLSCANVLLMCFSIGFRTQTASPYCWHVQQSC